MSTYYEITKRPCDFCGWPDYIDLALEEHPEWFESRPLEHDPDYKQMKRECWEGKESVYKEFRWTQ